MQLTLPKANRATTESQSDSVISQTRNTSRSASLYARADDTKCLLMAGSH